MSLIGYARVSTAEGRQWQASTCLPPSSSTGTPPGWAKRSLGERHAGLPVVPEFLPHISPLGWAHILLTGEYRWQKR